ncbi:MAG: SHOCT domain-containing protein [Thermoleophilaceae bacterium]
MPELLAAMAANRMRTRQSYRTVSRMQRRRSYVENRMGVRQDFQPAGEPAPQEAPPAAAAPAAPSYTAELAQLAQLRDQGVITAEDFEAKKKQILGI